MVRDVYKYFTAEQAIDGDIVPIYRAFGFDQVQHVDPFLLMDYFSCSNSIETQKFPWHPHRGIETLTYIKKGKFTYKDSLGNDVLLENGDAMWSKIGKGIMHQEIPHLEEGNIQGFHLWLNLKSLDKMSNPRHENYKGNEFPVYENNEYELKVLVGEYENVFSPFEFTREDFKLFDLELKDQKQFCIETKEDVNVVIFLYEGSISINGKSYCPYSTITLSKGNEVRISANENSQFLYMEGSPISEPIAWQGSIVMNTKMQLEKAYQQIENGTFAK